MKTQGENRHLQATWAREAREAGTGESLEAKSPLEMIYFQQEYILCHTGKTEAQKVGGAFVWPYLKLEMVLLSTVCFSSHLSQHLA